MCIMCMYRERYNVSLPTYIYIEREIEREIYIYICICISGCKA